MIVVTGGAGFIGSNLVAGLEAQGYRDIVVCDVLGADDKWKNIAKRELRDVVSPDSLMSFLEWYADEIDAIFHLGAISATTEKDADLIIENNFNLSCALWEWCAENDVRFIYASSAATYGDGDAGFHDDASVEHLAKLRPLNPYGWSKHLFDRRVARLLADQKEGRAVKVPPQWAGLKFFNVYGPHEYHKGDMMSVACKLFPQIMAGKTARLFKSAHPDYQDGGQMRDFVYVDDCVDIMLWLYQNKGVNGLFNVGSGVARSFKDLAEACYSALGQAPKIEYIDMPDHLKTKYQYFTQASMDKLRAAGYSKPITTLEDGVRAYMQDYMVKADQYK
ncbi:MAG TPA: ADP-glyceromanno-heptose 6-epimerase [Micavibrio sp.]